MRKIRAEVVIHGRVQGVFYRQSTVEMASRLGLNGWVKNCRDGTVKAVFEGCQEVIQQAVEWCHQGPPRALVTDIVIKWSDSTENLSGFSIER